MKLIAAIFGSSLGKKLIMAVTGLVLTGFVAGHLVGNLQIFGSPDQINGYAHFLQGLGPLLWLVRGVLLACVALHVWAAVKLTLENRKARPDRYAAENVIQATLASRTMRLTGFVVLAFIVYHIAHFTVGVAGSEHFKDNLPGWTMTHDAREFGIPLASAGTHVHDVYSMVFLGFANPLVSGFYILATSLLAFHLLHGAESLFQTLGLRTRRWGPALNRVVQVAALAYFAGNLAIPGAILTGLAKPADGTLAHRVMVLKQPLAEAIAVADAPRH